MTWPWGFALCELDGARSFLPVVGIFFFFREDLHDEVAVMVVLSEGWGYSKETQSDLSLVVSKLPREESPS